MLPDRIKKISIFEIDDGAIVYNRITKRSYRIGSKEYSLFMKLDGQTTNEELSQKTGYSIESISKMLVLLESYQLLSTSNLNCDKLTKKKHAIVYNTSFLKVFSKPIFRFLINSLTVVSFPLLLFSIIFMRGKIDAENIINTVNIRHFILMDLFLAFSVGLHELAHAVTASNNGAFCAEIGYKLDLFIPSAYTTICGIDEIKSKAKRVQVFFSGIALNAIIASVAVLLMNISLLKNNSILFILFCANILLILINSILFVKSDLYYIFCNLLDEPNLKENTIKMLQRKSCFSIGKVVYFLLTFIIEPIAVLILLLTALGKIGGNIL